MAETLPYMNSTGLVTKILNKIKEAKAPDRFSTDFQSTVLGYGSGSARPFISFAKRLGLINTDGSPTPLYHRFRGSAEESKAAMAEAMRKGYAPLYKRNEYAHNLDKKKLEGLVKEVTGLEDGNSALRAITGTFEALKAFADFDAAPAGDTGGGESGGGDEGGGAVGGGVSGGGGNNDSLRFGYTININLPDTNDIAVFNAIFKSMKEHLL